jgi:hypothetical protein
VREGARANHPATTGSKIFNEMNDASTVTKLTASGSRST